MSRTGSSELTGCIALRTGLLSVNTLHIRSLGTNIVILHFYKTSYCTSPIRIACLSSLSFSYASHLECHLFQLTWTTRHLEMRKSMAHEMHLMHPRKICKKRESILKVWKSYITAKQTIFKANMFQHESAKDLWAILGRPVLQCCVSDWQM